ncbi:MAG TPA: hypothetical protein PLK40_09610 [Bacteroidaceae bacterium]|nr:hypothetical protein [Bacteroidaceae bacterium]
MVKYLSLFIIVMCSVQASAAAHISIHTDTLKIQSYTVKEIRDSMVYMPSYRLPEVVVKAVEGNKKYLVLHSFFRTYTFADGYPLFYTEGFVDYYVNYKGKMTYRLHSCNTYKNNAALRILKLSKGAVKITNGGVPNIREYGFIPGFPSEYHFDYQGDKTMIYDKNQLKGSIEKHNPEFLSAEIDLMAPKTLITHHLLGFRLKKHEHKVYESLRGTLPLTSDNRLYVYMNYSDSEFKTKHTEYVRTQNIDEVYVINQSYCDRKNKPHTSSLFSSSITKSKGICRSDTIQQCIIPAVRPLVLMHLNQTLLRQ